MPTMKRKSRFPIPVIAVEGKRFGRLTPLHNLGSRWLCQCDCGCQVVLTASRLTSGHTESCGCLHRAVCRFRLTTHGRSKDPIYRTWASMWNRCTNPNSADFAGYGARGICVCRRWKSFENFLEDMGERPFGKSLDRIKTNKGYCPSNCRWATGIEQAQNQCTNVRLSFRGETLVLAEWARRLGFKKSTAIRRRLKSGWSVERALTTPKDIMCNTNS